MTTALNDHDLIELADSHQQQLLLVDIRSADEFAHEHITNSINVPLEKINTFDWQPHRNKTIVFYCRLGARTSQATPTIETLDLTNTYCLSEGIKQWKRCGLKTTVNKKAPISIMQQVQIIAGSLVLLGILLSISISPYFLILSTFVGCGLIFAGISGFCAIATLLRRLPWNKQ